MQKGINSHNNLNDFERDIDRCLEKKAKKSTIQSTGLSGFNSQALSNFKRQQHASEVGRDENELDRIIEHLDAKRTRVLSPSSRNADSDSHSMVRLSSRAKLDTQRRPISILSDTHSRTGDSNF